MDEILIREIKPQDNIILAKLIKNVFEELDLPKRGTVYSDPTTNNLFDLFNIPGAICFVAQLNNVVVGSAGIYPTPGLPAGYCEFSKYYVSKEGRGKGVGKKLIIECLDQAKRLGYCYVYLESFPSLTKAIEIYRKIGFTDLNAPLGNSGHFGCNVWQVYALK